MERLGPEFSQSVLQNSDGHVSQRVRKFIGCVSTDRLLTFVDKIEKIFRLTHSSPSADDIDAYLHNIAHKFGVDWKPRMKTDQK